MQEIYNKIYGNLKSSVYLNKNIFEDKNKLILTKEYKIEDIKRNFEAGKAFFIYSLLDITDEFFKLNNYNFSKITFQEEEDEINEYGDVWLSAIELSREIIDTLSYSRFENLEKGKVYKYLKENSEKYCRFFILGFKVAYQAINFNKILIVDKIEGCGKRNVSKIQKNISKMNSKDLEIKCNIIKQEFSKPKVKFILKNTDTEKKEEILKELISIEEELSDSSILAMSRNGTSRYWVGYFKSLDEWRYNLLEGNLSSGILNIVYFYLKLYEITGRDIYLIISKEIMSEDNLISAIGSGANLSELKFILKEMENNGLINYVKYIKKLKSIKAKRKYKNSQSNLNGYYLLNNKHKCLVGEGGIITYALMLVEKYEALL